MTLSALLIPLAHAQVILPVLLQVDVSDHSSILIKATGAFPIVNNNSVQTYFGVTLIDFFETTPNPVYASMGGDLRGGGVSAHYNRATWQDFDAGYPGYAGDDLQLWKDVGIEIQDFNVGSPAFTGTAILNLGSIAGVPSHGSGMIEIGAGYPAPVGVIGSWVIVPEAHEYSLLVAFGLLGLSVYRRWFRARARSLNTLTHPPQAHPPTDHHHSLHAPPALSVLVVSIASVLAAGCRANKLSDKTEGEVIRVLLEERQEERSAAVPLLAGALAGALVDAVQGQVEAEAAKLERQFSGSVYRSDFWTARAVEERFDLHLVSLRDTSGMPASARGLVVIRQLKDDTLYFRIFDRSQRVVVDTEEAAFADKAPALEALKAQLASSWNQDTISPRNKDAILDAVTFITDQPTTAPGNREIFNTYAGFSIKRYTQDFPESANIPAMEFTAAFRPSHNGRLFIIVPRKFLIREAKAKVINHLGAIDTTISVFVDAMWIDRYQLLRQERIASASFQVLNYSLADEPEELQTDALGSVVGWFPGVPVSVIPGSDTPLWDDDRFREHELFRDGAFKLTVVVTERDASKAKEYIERAATFLGEQRETVVKGAEGAAQ